MANRLNFMHFFCFLILTLGLLCSPLYAGDKVLKISLDTSQAGIPSFNPLTTSHTNNIYNLVYDRLVEMGIDGVIYPHLLKSWAVSEDGLTVTFTLKKGIKFHE